MGGIINFSRGNFFYWVVRTWGVVILIKIKMVQEQWLLLKMTIITWKFLFILGGGFFDFRWGGNKNLVWREGIFPGGGGGWSNFWLVGGDSPIPPLGKTLACGHDFWYTCVNWWYLWVFFSLIFLIFVFSCC